MYNNDNRNNLIFRYIFTSIISLFIVISLAVCARTIEATYNPASYSAKAIRSGTISVGAADVTESVSFSTAMPSTSYNVFFERAGTTTGATVLTVSSKTVNGFTMNLSIVVGLGGETVNYTAIQQ